MKSGVYDRLGLCLAWRGCERLGQVSGRDRRRENDIQTALKDCVMRVEGSLKLRLQFWKRHFL
jgi:hypothetical protein